MSPQSLRIAIDGRAALWPRTGVGTITHNVLKHMPAVDPGNQYFAYFDSDPGSRAGEYSPIVCFHGGTRNRLLWSNTWLPRQLKRQVIDVFITFLDKEIPFLPCPSRIVSMVHDLIPLRFPEVMFRSAAHRFYYNALIRGTVRRSDLVLTNSEFSKQEIVAEFGVDERKVHKLPLGTDAPNPIDSAQADDVLRRYGLTRPYVLALGSTEPRKNNAKVIEAMRLLAPTHPNLQLAIAGKNWRGVQFPSDLVDRRVRLLGHVADVDLPAIIASAEMLVFPSLHEGFGFPVIEAMALGVPVVTSNVTALPEVGGDAALYADPNSAADIADKMQRILINPALAATLRSNGLERAKTFRWQSTCAEIAGLCEAMMETSQWRQTPVLQ